MKRIATVVVVTALAVAGCNRKQGEEAKAPDAPAAAQAPKPPLDAPVRKPGLWEQRVSMEGVDAVQVTRVCLDKATDQKLSWWGNQAARSTCSKNLVSRQTDGAWRFSSVCDMGSGGVTTTSGAASGDFDDHYQVTAESSTQGAAVPQMNGIRKVTIDAKHQGPCPAEMKPGEMEMPGVGRVNMLELQAVGAGG